MKRQPDTYRESFQRCRCIKQNKYGKIKILLETDIRKFQEYFYDKSYSRKVSLPPSMESMMARDSRWIPISRMVCPPDWKPFSITIPAPSRVAPDFFTMSIRPRSAQPFARKSSIRVRDLQDQGISWKGLHHKLSCV